MQNTVRLRDQNKADQTFDAAIVGFLLAPSWLVEQTGEAQFACGLARLAQPSSNNVLCPTNRHPKRSE